MINYDDLVIEDLVTTAQYVDAHPGVTVYIIQCLFKTKVVDRYLVADIVKAFPDTPEDIRVGWGTTQVSRRTYLYDYKAIDTALKDVNPYVEIGALTQKGRKNLPAALRGAAKGKQAPIECHGPFLHKSAFGPQLQRAITLTAPEVALVDALGFQIAAALTAHGGFIRPTWCATLKRLVGMTIVSLHPAMLDRNIAAYRRFVASDEFDLMTLVGNLGYDDLTTFAEDLFAAYAPGVTIGHPTTILDMITKHVQPDSYVDPTNPLYKTVCDLKVQLAESIANQQIASLTGIPHSADIINYLLLLGEPRKSPLELHDFVRATTHLSESGIKFTAGEICITDREKALDFVCLVQEAVREATTRS
jgi:hypothetical protein